MMNVLKISISKEKAMQKTWILCLLGLLSLGSAAWSQAQTTGATEKAVAALEQQWLQSQKTNNPDLVAPLLADKFVSTGSDGKVMNKAETLADAKATKYESMEYEDVKVTVFGDTAIATGGSKAKGTDASGKPMDNHSRWTDTWVKMPSGKWQCVASHVSPVKM
jgi:ketosteroid isomerase-like protein